MDNIPDQPLELNSKKALQAQMDRTRQSISETVSSLRMEIGQALDWQTYVRRHPGTCLVSGGRSWPSSRASHEGSATRKSGGRREAATAIKLA